MMEIVSKLKAASRHLPASAFDALYSQALGARVRTGRFGSPEPEFEHLNLLVPADENVIDGGANFGIFALAIAPLLQQDRWVFAFEPVLNTRRMLMKQIARAGLANVAVFPTALSDNDGFVGLEAPSFDDGRTNLFRSEISTDTPANALALRGEILAGLGPVGFIKLDVEGHEKSALVGLSAILRDFSPNLLVEGHTDEVSSFLSGFGYESAILEDSPNTVFVSTSRDPAGETLERLTGASRSVE